MFENYLLLAKSIYLPILKFKTSNHNLPVETGRWQNILPEDRHCQLCNSLAVGDEFHYLFRCEALLQQRNLYLKEKHIKWANIITFKRILTTKNLKELKNLSKFITSIHTLITKS